MLAAFASFLGFKAAQVPAAVESPGKRPKKTIIDVKLKPGGLSRFGYHAELSLRSRHIALLKAVRQEGYLPIIRRLNLIATWSKNRTPGFSRIFKMDQRWLSKRYASRSRSRSPNLRAGGRGTSPTTRASQPTDDDDY